MEDKFDLTVTLARVMFPFLIFIGFAALAMGILNALRRFTVPALAPAVLNVGVISGVLFLPPYLDPPILGLAIGELIGGLLQFAIQVPPLLKEKIAFRLRWRPSDPGLAQIRRLFLAFLVGAGALQINNFVLTILASYLAAGSVSYLYYGMRLIHLPLGVFGVAMATAILPALSVQATHGEVGRLRETFASGMSLVLLITVPAAVGLVSFAGPIVSTIFMRGAFDAAAVHGTALAVMAYAVGLWAFAAVRVAVSAFYSMQETRVPVAGTLVTVAANLILSLLLMGPLEHAGLALATALAAVLNLGFLLYFLRRRLETIGDDGSPAPSSRPWRDRRRSGSSASFSRGTPSGSWTAGWARRPFGWLLGSARVSRVTASFSASSLPRSGRGRGGLSGEAGDVRCRKDRLGLDRRRGDGSGNRADRPSCRRRADALSEMSSTPGSSPRVRGDASVRLEKKAISLLADYFRTGRMDWNLPLDLDGATDFEKKVWRAAREIPEDRS